MIRLLFNVVICCVLLAAGLYYIDARAIAGTMQTMHTRVDHVHARCHKAAAYAGEFVQLTATSGSEILASISGVCERISRNAREIAAQFHTEKPNT